MHYAGYCFCRFSDILPQDESANGVDGDSEDSRDDTGITEDIRQLLINLIDHVVQDTGSENDCARMPLKRHATDIPVSSSEPERKRPFRTSIPKMVFNPIAEHYLWCPCVSDIVCTSGAVDIGAKPWLRLLRQLVPDPQAAFTCIQTSPVPEGIARIRKLIRSWTLPVQRC